MSPRSVIGGLTLLRPFLGVRRAALREFLAARQIAWREDPSNQWPNQKRNRVRQVLAASPGLSEALLMLGSQCRALQAWLDRHAPKLDEAFHAAALHQVSEPLAREAARRWLKARGARPGELNSVVLSRLVMMASDAASAPRQYFPGGILVRRRAGRIFVNRGG